MRRDILVAPSLLSANFSKLGTEIKALEEGGADWIHIDVMDGHFVPNLTMGPTVIKDLRPLTDLWLDVHLMISPVDSFIPAFAKAGADSVTIHPEAGPHPYRTLQHIHDVGLKAGVALSPGTPVSVVEPLLEITDLILVMTVNPGFGGQAFLPCQLKKISALRKRIDQSGRTITLQVDGGITPETGAQCVAAGAHVLVAGTWVFKGGDYSRAIAALKAGA